MARMVTAFRGHSRRRVVWPTPPIPESALSVFGSAPLLQSDWDIPARSEIHPTKSRARSELRQCLMGLLEFHDRYPPERTARPGRESCQRFVGNGIARPCSRYVGPYSRFIVEIPIVGRMVVDRPVGLPIRRQYGRYHI